MADDSQCSTAAQFESDMTVLTPNFEGPRVWFVRSYEKTSYWIMITSSNGNIFRVTGHLCGEFTGHRWIPRTKASDAELWCFLWSAPNKRLSKQSWGWWFETPSWSLWRQCDAKMRGYYWATKAFLCSFTFLTFFGFTHHNLPIKCHIHNWYVPPQLSCVVACQPWMWYNGSSIHHMILQYVETWQRY